MMVAGEMLIMPETAGGSTINPLAASIKDGSVAEGAERPEALPQVACCDSKG